jgi:NhaP-type Na+/H+ or K+/H+ antiporter
MMTGLLLTLYLIIDAYMEKLKPRYGHVSGIIMIIGVLISWIYWETDSTLVNSLTTKFIFNFALPFIVANEGYNMKRK